MPAVTTSILCFIECYSPIKEEKEIKGINIRKEEMKLPLFSDDIYICQNPPGRCKITTRMNKFSGYKVNIQKSNMFL